MPQWTHSRAASKAIRNASKDVAILIDAEFVPASVGAVTLSAHIHLSVQKRRMKRSTSLKGEPPSLWGDNSKHHRGGGNEQKEMQPEVEPLSSIQFSQLGVIERNPQNGQANQANRMKGQKEW